MGSFGLISLLLVFSFIVSGASSRRLSSVSILGLRTYFLRLANCCSIASIFSLLDVANSALVSSSNVWLRFGMPMLLRRPVAYIEFVVRPR